MKCKTAISVAERMALDMAIQNWHQARDEQQEALELVSRQLSIDFDQAIDLLNGCLNSRAMLDELGVEVFDDWRPPEPMPAAARRVPWWLAAWFWLDYTFHWDVVLAWFIVGCGATFLYCLWW